MTNNHNILDVLSYMFDYIFETSSSIDQIDDTTLKTQLTEAGFDENGINKAFVWLDNITSLQDDDADSFQTNQNSIRFYTQAEKEKIDLESRNFLYFMYSVGQLNATQREVIIDQMMSLESDELSLDDLKWVIIMMLGNNLNQKTTNHWLEAIILDDSEQITLQ